MSGKHVLAIGLDERPPAPIDTDDHMDDARRQRLVERIWLIEQLRGEAQARADRATTEARLARERAADAGRQAADLHERVAGLGNELADLHDQLGDQSRAAQERADARAERRQAAEEGDLSRPRTGPTRSGIPEPG